MQIIDLPTAIQERVAHLLRPILKTGGQHENGRFSTDWGRIEVQIQEWEQHPKTLDDDDLDLPSRATIQLIRDVCHALSQHAVDPPLRLVPNLDGGAAFEWRASPYLWSVEVERDGALESSVFRDGRLVTRHRIS